MITTYFSGLNRLIPIKCLVGHIGMCYNCTANMYPVKLCCGEFDLSTIRNRQDLAFPLHNTTFPARFTSNRLILLMLLFPTRRNKVRNNGLPSPSLPFIWRGAKQRRPSPSLPFIWRGAKQRRPSPSLPFIWRGAGGAFWPSF